MMLILFILASYSALVNLSYVFFSHFRLMSREINKKLVAKFDVPFSQVNLATSFWSTHFLILFLV